MAEPIRVLQFVTQMNRGGMENRLMDLYRNLDRDRVQLDFYTLRKEEGQFDEEIRALGGRIFYGEPLDVRHLFAIPGRICTFLKKHPEYSVCHAHLNQWCGLILEGARRAGVPTRVAHARTALSGRGADVFVKNLIRRLFSASPTHRFAVSEKAAIWLYGKRKASAGLCEVWPNAIESNKFLFDPVLRAKTRSALGLAEEYTVLHVGNLRPMKNHEFLFRVFCQIRKREKNACLLLAGDGERKAHLESLAEDMGIGEAVHFLGNRADIPALLSAADVFVFPSFYEGLPGAVLEAQASDLPCLISDTIAEEVFLSDRAKALSIEAPPEVWAEAALSTHARARENRRQLFVKTGYDVASLAERLCAFYESAAKKGD